MRYFLKVISATVPYEPEAAYTADVVFTQERDTFTGLLNYDGQEIHRAPEPFGFDPQRWKS